MCTCAILTVKIGAKCVSAHANDRLMSCVEIAKPHTPRHSTHAHSYSSNTLTIKKVNENAFMRSIHKFLFSKLTRYIPIKVNIFKFHLLFCSSRSAHSIDTKQYNVCEVATRIRPNIWSIVYLTHNIYNVLLKNVQRISTNVI